MVPRSERRNAVERDDPQCITNGNLTPVLLDKPPHTFHVNFHDISTPIKRELQPLNPQNIHVIIERCFTGPYRGGGLLYCQAIFFINFLHPDYGPQNKSLSMHVIYTNS